MKSRAMIWLLVCALTLATLTLPVQAQDGAVNNGQAISNDSSSSDDNTDTILIGLFTVILVVLAVIGLKSDRARRLSEVTDDAYAFDNAQEEKSITLGEEGLSLKARF